MGGDAGGFTLFLLGIITANRGQKVCGFFLFLGFYVCCGAAPPLTEKVLVLT